MPSDSGVSEQQLEQPLASIVVATYNRTQYVDEMLDSLVAQTYQNKEIIVIDDGSTDGTADFVAQYIQDKGYGDIVKYYPQKENRGVAAAMTIGMDHCNGEYIAHIGSDDIWKPENLEKQIALLEAKPEVGLVYSDVSRMDQDKKILSESRFVENGIGAHRGNIFADLLLKGMFVTAISVVFRKSLYDEVGGFDDTMQISNDYDFFVRCAAHAEIDYIDEPLAYWRMHDNNLHKRDKTATYLERIKVLRKNYAAYGKQQNVPFWRIRLAVSNLYLQVGLEAMKTKKRGAAANAFSQAIVQFPLNPLAYVFMLNLIPNIAFFWDIQRWKTMYLTLFK